VEGVKMIAISRFGAAFFILISVVVAQEWHKETLPFCSQIKAKSAKVSNRSFSVFAAPRADSSCCADLPVTSRGKTEQFGYFKVRGLSEGRYFVVFDLKTKQVVVPILFDRTLDMKDCAPSSRITVDKVTSKLIWEDWVTLD
jgi:hypothetical protein